MRIEILANVSEERTTTLHRKMIFQPFTQHSTQIEIG